MPPDELIPSNRNELSRRGNGVNPITSQMARDLLARSKEMEDLANAGAYRGSADSNLGDETFMNLLQKGDEKTWQEAFSTLRTSSYNVAHKMGLSKTEIVEICMAVLSELPAKMASYKIETFEDLSRVTVVSTTRKVSDLLRRKTIEEERKGEIIEGNTGHFKCPDLEKAIRKELEKPEGEVTRKDMVSLVALRNNYTKIADLSGLELATNLQTLSFEDNRKTPVPTIPDFSPTHEPFIPRPPFPGSLSDLSPLAGLKKLREINLNWYQITDLSPLANLPSLTELRLARNKIADLSPLASLTNLELLSVRGNPVTSLEIDMLKKALPNCEIIL